MFDVLLFWVIINFCGFAGLIFSTCQRTGLTVTELYQIKKYKPSNDFEAIIHFLLTAFFFIPAVMMIMVKK